MKSNLAGIQKSRLDRRVIGGHKPTRTRSFSSFGGADAWIAGGVSLFFGGAAGAWFAPGAVGHHLPLHLLQLAGGTMAMAMLVASLGTVFTGRNAIRWGVGMPLLVYFLGTLLALAGGREGALGLLLGAPVFAGIAIAGGLLTTCLFDGARATRAA